MMRFLQMSAILVVLSACGTRNIDVASTTKSSQLQTRQLQVKKFVGRGIQDTMNAVVQTLMDEGFAVNNSNAGLGFITASKSRRVVDPNMQYNLLLKMMFIGDYPTVHVLKITALLKNVEAFTQVRLSLTEELLNKHGGIINSRMVNDRLIYQKLFSKIDKAIFLDKHRL